MEKKEIKFVLDYFVEDILEYTSKNGTTLNEIINGYENAYNLGEAIKKIKSGDYKTEPNDPNGEKDYLDFLIINAKEGMDGREDGVNLKKEEVVDLILKFTSKLENALNKYEEDILRKAQSEAELLIDWQKGERDLKEVEDLEYIEEFNILEALEIAESLKRDINNDFIDDYFNKDYAHEMFSVNSNNKHLNKIIVKLIGIKTLDIYNEEIDSIIQDFEYKLELIEDVNNEMYKAADLYVQNYKENISDMIFDHIKNNHYKPNDEYELNIIAREYIDGIIQDVENLEDNFEISTEFEEYMNENQISDRIIEEIKEKLYDICKDFEKNESCKLLEQFKLHNELSHF